MRNFAENRSKPVRVGQSQHFGDSVSIPISAGDPKISALWLTRIQTIHSCSVHLLLSPRCACAWTDAL